MPLHDLVITIQVKQKGGGAEHTESFDIPADSNAGLNLSAGQKQKLGDRLTTCGNLSDENGTPL